MGRILQTLFDSRLDDNTIIVYTSDHGDMMGSHKLLTKGVICEEAIRVPCMISLPAQKTGSRIANPVSQIDIVPTILELLGETVPSDRQGMSLVPALRGTEPERDVFIEWTGSPHLGALENPKVLEKLADSATAEDARAAVADPVRTIVSPDRWKLCVSPLGEHRMFDLMDDPLETSNALTNKANTNRADSMLRRLIEWQKRTDDTVTLPETLQ